jgi:hypothetical protein
VGELEVDVAIIGGGLGAVSAALAALERGARVAITEPTTWLGGQLTSQLVPLDEHFFIETTGANESYRRFRSDLREHYRRYYPLTDAARADPRLNPGAAWVSPLSVEPRAALAVIESRLTPYVAGGHLHMLMRTCPVAAETEQDHVRAVIVEGEEGTQTTIRAAVFLDATEYGDLLALAGVEFVSGREARADTGEPHAAETADPTDMQGATWCFVVDHIDGDDHTIEKPADYEYYRSWAPPHRYGVPVLDFRAGINAEGSARRVDRFEVNPDDDPFLVDLDHRNMGRSPDLWTYRRIAARRQFVPGAYESDIVVINWTSNDYVGGPLFGVDDAAVHQRRAKELSAALLYWLQTEAPRPDGGAGWPGLRLRPDIAGTDDGFAMAPYVRESRRLRARTTIREQDISVALRGERGAVTYSDSVGVGHYYWIDRHPTTGGNSGSGGLPHPFQIPLGALIPVRVRNVLPAAKNIGTTQITNGSYRVHPVEWSIGEAAGSLAAFAVRGGIEPPDVLDDPRHLRDYQEDLDRHGVQRRWPDGLLWSATADTKKETGR